MVKVIKYDDFEVWNKGHLLALAVYSISNENENLFKNLALKNDMRLSTLGIITNLAESFKRESKRQFNFFLNRTKGSLARLKSQIIRAYDSKCLTRFEYDILIRQLMEVESLVESLKKSNFQHTS